MYIAMCVCFSSIEMRADKLSTRVKEGGMEIAGLSKEYFLPDTMAEAIQGCLNLDAVNRQLFPQVSDDTADSTVLW